MESGNNAEAQSNAVHAALKMKMRQDELKRKAFELVMHISLADSVTEKELIYAGQNITQDNYFDITEERSIGKLCGYPLCSNALGQVLKQKYKISVATATVYDITDRKKFCSNECYLASKHFHQQISDIPLLLRETGRPVKFTLLSKEKIPNSARDGCGEIVLERPWRKVKKELELLNEADSAACNEDATTEVGEEKLEIEDEQLKRTEKLLSLFAINERFVEQPRVEEKPSIMIQGKKDFEQELVNQQLLQQQQLPQQHQLSQPQQQPEEKQNLPSLPPQQQPQQQKSLIEKLKSIHEWKTSKTTYFFNKCAQPELSAYGTKVMQYYGATNNEKEEENIDITLPDHFSQNIQRTKIVLEKLSHVWPKLERLLQVDLKSCLSDLRDLIHTFKFSSKNILFKPDEWLVVGYILIRVCNHKVKQIGDGKDIRMNVASYSLTEEGISEIIDCMCSGDMDMEMVD